MFGIVFVTSAFLAATSPALLAATVAPAPAAGYRLAGIIDSGSNNRVGFLQLPRGGQVLIRLGSVIEGGGRVIEFSKRAVRIAFADGRFVTIDLEGAGTNGLPVNANAGSHPVEIDPIVTLVDDHGQTLVRRVEVARFAKAIAKQGVAEGDITLRLQTLLKLPVDSRIVAVNEGPIGSAPVAIKKIQALLANNESARLNLESPSGAQRVYLMPDDPRRP